MSDDAPPGISRRELLATGVGAAALLVAARGAGALAAVRGDAQLGRAQPFNSGWRFQHVESAGGDQGLELQAFDDTAWRAVDLPHDWSIEDLPAQGAAGTSATIGPFDPKSPGGTATGFAVGGEGWYRKRFRLAQPPKGRVEILFEGIYMNSEVWINGHSLGAHPYGYTPRAHDLTPWLASDGNNVLAVRVRNLGQNSRWYSGSGIYRPVWLDVLPGQARIARWGVGIVTRRIVDGTALLEISTRTEDAGDGLTLVQRVKDEAGRVVRELAAPAKDEALQALTLESVRLWSPEHPALYSLETELRRGNDVLDRVEQAFGVRIVSFDVDSGMAINGVPAKLRGGCIHHDNGLLGAAAFDAAEQRKVRLLKARGFNAVRPSHNPFSSAFLRACDRQGLLVVGETFDAWRKGKLPDDYSLHFDAHWRDDLAKLVLGARNHPSIILWSIGNEIPGRYTQAGLETQWQLANEVHRLDPTRPVTAAVNGFAGRPVTPSAQAARTGAAGVPDQAGTVFLDLIGYNYKLDDYAADRERFPRRLFFGTESFPRDMAAIWDLTERTPWLLGDFVWTAMDYLGEAGIGGSVLVPASAAGNPFALGSAWPWVNAYCGDIDLIGQQKAASLARDVSWGISLLEVTVARPAPEGLVEGVRLWGWRDEWPSWSWPGDEGRSLAVRVYSAGDRVELRLNGQALASKALAASDLRRCEFTVHYAPGTLEVVAFRQGIEIARKRLVTAGQPASLRLVPELARGMAARGDIHFVVVEVLDAMGHVVPDAASELRLRVTGPAELIAFGSANPLAVGSFQANSAQTWKGRALAILRSRGKPGAVRLEAGSEGLHSGSTTIHLA